MKIRIIANNPLESEFQSKENLLDKSKYIGKEFEVVLEHENDVLVMLEKGKFLTVFTGEYEITTK
jgi:hypothetical protein